jgi:hypothetical protein
MVTILEDIERLKKLANKYPLPRMVKIRQKFDPSCISDVISELGSQFNRKEIRNRMDLIQPGHSVAITAGSRGITGIAVIIREVVSAVREKGGIPFVFPAMGSHGGACAEGQVKILADYNITEEFVGAPIKAGMEVTYIGDTEDGRPTYIDAMAAAADHIIVVNRIKPHTVFRGKYESGLMKMMVIGMGKQAGAERVHDRGFGHMAEDLQAFGKSILKHAPVLVGIGIVENAYDDPCRICAMTPDEIITQEPDLLQYAFSRMGRILFPEIDILIVDRIGKNISGDGMDPNITGRVPSPYATGMLDAQRVAVLDLTDETHGNCFGVGMADVTTRRLVDKANLEMMYINALTSTLLPATKIPIIAQNHRDAIGICIKTCNNIDRYNPRIVRIPDTLHLKEISISEALLAEAEEHEDVEITGSLDGMAFDGDGNLFK